jgi:hypothetical protein
MDQRPQRLAKNTTDLMPRTPRVKGGTHSYFQARLAFTMAAFNVLVQWHGLLPNASGFVPLSIDLLSSF